MMYSFDIEYRKTSDFGNADGLSRLPDPRELPSAQMVINEVKEKRMASEIWEEITLDEKHIAEATQEDEVLRKVYKYVTDGWPERVKDPNMKPFEKRKLELQKYNGCLMWGNRIVLPKKFQRIVLKILHNSHFGRNRMTALARKKVWYPEIDRDIRLMAQSCEICAAFGNDPIRTPLHPWETPQKVWQRLHLDFAETTGGKMWLIMIDAKSKWPEVIKMNSTTAEKNYRETERRVLYPRVT